MNGEENDNKSKIQSKRKIKLESDPEVSILKFELAYDFRRYELDELGMVILMLKL